MDYITVKMTGDKAKMKKLMNTMYGKLIERPPPYVMHHAKPDKDIRSSPLIKEFWTEPHKDTTYVYFNDVDWSYRYVMVASLLLAQQRKNMREVFNLCRQHKIPMYATSADSIAIPTSALHYFEPLMGNGLGQFKIEAQNDVGIFVRPGLYYVGPKKVVNGLPKGKSITEFFPEERSVEDIYRKLARGELEFHPNLGPQ